MEMPSNYEYSKNMQFKNINAIHTRLKYIHVHVDNFFSFYFNRLYYKMVIFFHHYHSRAR